MKRHERKAKKAAQIKAHQLRKLERTLPGELRRWTAYLEGLMVEIRAVQLRERMLGLPRGYIPFDPSEYYDTSPHGSP